MASDRRVERLESLIHREVIAIFKKGVNDPRIGEITVTRIRLSKDLRYCKVYVVCLGTETQQRTTFRGLQSATSMIQYRIASVLTIRNTPIFKIELDKNPEKAQEMASIFDKIAAERQSEEPEESSEENPEEEA